MGNSLKQGLTAAKSETAFAQDGRELMQPQFPKAEAGASFLAAIVDSSDDAIVSKDLNGVITSWNRGAERIFGYNSAEVIGRPVTILIPPDHIDEEPKILERIRRGERVDHYETVRRRKNGSEVDVSLTVSPIKDLRGKIIGASKIARDITEKRRAEERLRQSEERFRVTLASIGDAVIATDNQGRVTFLNPVAEELTGWNHQQALGLRLDEIFKIVNELTRRPVENPVGRVLRDGIVVGLANHTILISKDGKEWPIDDSAAPIRGLNGVLAGVVLVFRDATKQRMAESNAQKLVQLREEQARNLEVMVSERTAQLQQTVLDLEAFSSTISHDLRSPLRAMQGFAQAIAEDYGDKLDPLGRDYLERISNSAMRLDHLIRELLTFSRAGRSELSIEPIDFNKLLDEVLVTYPDIQGSSAEITIKGPLHPVLGGHASLVQVVSNLLSNAVKFVDRGEKAKVRVWTEKHDSKVQLFIEDHGIGIPESLLSKIFDPFQRGHPQSGYEGTGMGLAIVRKAVERMNGTVGVRSREGTGSTFWIELPAAPNDV
jgi:PAS domain S-box-containing protein